jgi:outer membrane protein TolC
MTRYQRALLLLIASTALSQRAAAQLTLAAAMHQADRSAFANRIAGGAAAERRAQALAPLKGILPSVHVEAGYVRTTDPIGAFGSTLRQRTITQADFAPSHLNYPGAVGNYQGGIVVEQPLLNADAWLGRRVALRAVDATHASETWTHLSIRVDVVRAYYGSVLASERAAVLRSAAHAAHAHQAQAEAMVRQGMVTKSDALLAAVRAGEVDAQLAEAIGTAMTARRQLAVLLGGDGADLPESMAEPNALPPAERIRAVVGTDTAFSVGEPRADVDAASHGLEAAHADVSRARSTYLPRINSFARYDWNSPNRIYAGDRNWTAGVLATWSLFAGASDIADLQATSARETNARAQAEAAQANGRLQVEQTRTALIVALTRLEIAERAVAQSAEAHRIVARKYVGGLASVTELLDAQTVDTQSSLAFAQARYTVIVDAAERRLAIGRDPGTLVVLDAESIVADRTVRTASDRDQQ